MSRQTPPNLAALSPAARRLARLIPQVYLARNESLPGRPLFALLEVLAEPMQELEKAIDQLGEDHFVETASAGALEHLAALIGARLAGHGTGANRGIVARTIHWRRRKGTGRTLEEVLTATTGWSTEVDEAFRSLLHNQDLANPVPWRGQNAILWDPVALVDPLSRCAPPVERPRHGPVLRGPYFDDQENDLLPAAMLRLGRSDAGRYAASPRSIDLTGWARPEVALIRTSRFVQQELDRVTLPLYGIARIDSSEMFHGLFLDPWARDRCLVRRRTIPSTGATACLTPAHEKTVSPAPTRSRYDLLTPTALAADGDRAEQDDNLSIFIDGVPLIGGQRSPTGHGTLSVRPLPLRSVLRFADLARPSPGEQWLMELVAVDNPETIDFNSPADPDFIEPGPGVENPALARTVTAKGTTEGRISSLAAVPRSGSRVCLRLARPRCSIGYQLDSSGSWITKTMQAPPGEPFSTTVVTAGSDPIVLRMQRLPGEETDTLVLASRRLEDPAGAWKPAKIDWSAVPAAERPRPRLSCAGPGFSALLYKNHLLLAGPTASGREIGVWQIADPATTAPVADRLDHGAADSPGHRFLAALCIREDQLYLFGGQDDRQILGDFWSLPLTGESRGRWQVHRTRNRQRRCGGRLVDTGNGLLLLGGASRPGELDTSVWYLDPDAARPAWIPEPSLPLAPGLPGVLWVHDQENTISILAWAGSTLPQLFTSRPDRLHWKPLPMDRQAAPNPPAEGEVVCAAGHWHLLAPSPLPPSEVLFSMGAEGYLAFLPALDPGADDRWSYFFIGEDGSSRRLYSAGEPGRLSLRLGAGREAQVRTRRAPAMRIGTPARLQWTPLILRQRNLGPWDRPLALRLDGVVALDPRLGRLLLPSNIATGTVQVSYRIGRATALGAGFGVPGSRPPAWWLEPEQSLQPPVPPEQENMSVTARVDPRRAGTMTDSDIPVVATPRLGITTDTSTHLLAIDGSPRFAADRLYIRENEQLSLYAADRGGYPHFARDTAGISLSLLAHPAPAQAEEAGPRYWLSGLSLQGRLAIAFASGQVILRWCDFAAPGATAVEVAGAEHQSPMARRSIPESSLTLWLFGCILGRLAVPPWVLVVAAGCLFDGGSRDGTAIAAAGARVRLRHCTVRGMVFAGILQASSCAFQGPVRCDRPDRSWIRYSLLPKGDGQPPVYASRLHPVSFASCRPTDPDYLLLDTSNGPGALQTGEQRRMPGAHAPLGVLEKELHLRSSDYLPLAMVGRQIDRSAMDLTRMNRRESA